MHELGVQAKPTCTKATRCPGYCTKPHWHPYTGSLGCWLPHCLSLSDGLLGCHMLLSMAVASEIEDLRARSRAPSHAVCWEPWGAISLQLWSLWSSLLPLPKFCFILQSPTWTLPATIRSFWPQWPAFGILSEISSCFLFKWLLCPTSLERLPSVQNWLKHIHSLDPWKQVLCSHCIPVLAPEG